MSSAGVRFLSLSQLFTPAELLPVSTLPTPKQLKHASTLTVFTETGQEIQFGSLFAHRKTIVCFIRHFWCPLCADYMTSITANADPLTLARNGVSLVIISNGSWKMIKSYRRIFSTPYAVYTNPSLELYNAMGMTIKTLDGGSEREKGSYVKHGLFGGIAMVIKNAAKARVPVWEQGGDIEQLGGEFVLGPGPKASYANRMNTTRSHAPVRQVLRAAGIDLDGVQSDSNQVLDLGTITSDHLRAELRRASALVGVSAPDTEAASCGSIACTLPSLTEDGRSSLSDAETISTASPRRRPSPDWIDDFDVSDDEMQDMSARMRQSHRPHFISSARPQYRDLQVPMKQAVSPIERRESDTTVVLKLVQGQWIQV